MGLSYCTKFIKNSHNSVGMQMKKLSMMYVETTDYCAQFCFLEHFKEIGILKLFMSVEGTGFEKVLLRHQRKCFEYNKIKQ